MCQMHYLFDVCNEVHGENESERMQDDVLDTAKSHENFTRQEKQIQLQ